MTADQASGALALETIAADRAKERDAIDAGPARCFGHVAAGLLEELRDVVTLEALEQLGLRHAERELLQPLVGSLVLQGGRTLAVSVSPPSVGAMRRITSCSR